MNKEVTAYIQSIAQPWQKNICKKIRALIHKSVPNLTERMQYGKPHFLRDGKYVCVLGVARNWVSLTIFNADRLMVADGFFEPGGSPERRTVKILQNAEPDYDLLGELIPQTIDL